MKLHHEEQEEHEELTGKYKDSQIVIPAWF